MSQNQSPLIVDFPPTPRRISVDSETTASSSPARVRFSPTSHLVFYEAQDIKPCLMFYSSEEKKIFKKKAIRDALALQKIIYSSRNSQVLYEDERFGKYCIGVEKLIVQGMPRHIEEYKRRHAHTVLSSQHACATVEELSLVSQESSKPARIVAQKLAANVAAKSKSSMMPINSILLSH